MIQKEFEELTGMSVPVDVFEDIHEAYMNCGDSVDKQTFCKEWKMLRDSAVFWGLANKAAALKTELTNTEKEYKSMVNDLLSIAVDEKSLKVRNYVVWIVGFKKYASLVLEKYGKLPFEEDVQELISTLNQ